MIVFPKLLLLWTAFFILVIGLPALFTPKKFTSILDKTLKNSDIVRTLAFLTMIIGLFFLSVYRKLNQGWMMVFSIFGWLSLIKGLFLLRFPSWGQTKYKLLYAKPMGSFIIGLFILLFSLFIIRVACYKI